MKYSQLIIRVSIGIVLALGVFTSGTYAQSVSPFQTGHYMPAFSNVRDMAYPPSGLFILSYNYYSFADSYYDKDGNKTSTLELGQVDPNLPSVELDLSVNSFATVPAFFWASKGTILGGARYMAGVTPVYFWANANIGTSVFLNELDTTLTESSKEKLSGFSDTYFAPLGLSWGSDHVDFTFFYGFTTPNGKYETGADDNIGMGFWTHQVQGFGYYYPNPDQSTALMAGLTYEINGKIKDADFKPGSRLSLEWGLSQYVSEKLELSIMGGHNWQVSDDTGDDVFWDVSQHDKKSTITFNAGYWAWADKLQVTARYGFDFGMRQRFKTDLLMVNLLFIPNLLTGEKATE